MRIPTFKQLEADQLREGGVSYSYAMRMHPNPYFYKYYWWVFWKGSPCEGHAFLNSSKTRLSTKEAYELRNKLAEENLSYYLYNESYPRLDASNNPWDPSSERWNDTQWAIAYDEDTDEPYKGHK
ncbi:MAG: hypothetical protein D0531_12175 [Methylococcales bacterium]|nr:MAG: hypothetical protein D0531_12175 [Methylococcales bacterium]